MNLLRIQCVPIYLIFFHRPQIKKAPSSVVDLTPENFDAVVGAPGVATFVEFFAPCELCFLARFSYAVELISPACLLITNPFSSLWWTL